APVGRRRPGHVVRVPEEHADPPASLRRPRLPGVPPPLPVAVPPARQVQCDRPGQQDPGVGVAGVHPRGGCCLNGADALPAAAIAGGPAPPAAPPTVPLLGFRVSNVTLTQAVDHIAGSIAAGRGGWVLTPNLDILRRIIRQADFADLVAGTTMRLA